MTLARLMAFLLVVLPVCASGQSGLPDPVLAHVRPVTFCVDPFPVLDPENPDFAEWSFPGGAPDPVAVGPDNRVAGRTGIAFGFEVRAAGPGRLQDVTVIVDHPAQPKTGQTQHSWVSSFPDNTIAVNFFGFGKPDEIALGTWTFTYVHDGRVIYTHAFEVVEPALTRMMCPSGTENET